MKGAGFELVCSGCLNAVSWCFEESQTPYAFAVLDLVSEGAQAHVPAIWPLEVTNALVKALRRQQIKREELFEYAQRLADLRVTVDPHGSVFDEILALAERYQLTTYDASYLELAKRKGIPLATSDNNLIQAASAIAVSILQA